MKEPLSYDTSTKTIFIIFEANQIQPPGGKKKHSPSRLWHILLEQHFNERWFLFTEFNACGAVQPTWTQVKITIKSIYVFSFFFFLFGRTHSMCKFLGRHRTCATSDNTESLTCCATRELHVYVFSYFQFAYKKFALHS